MSTDKIVIPLVPLRDIVVFPFMVIPLFVGRERSVRALEKSMADQKNIFLSAQRNANHNKLRCHHEIETYLGIGTANRRDCVAVE